MYCHNDSGIELFFVSTKFNQDIDDNNSDWILRPCHCDNSKNLVSQDVPRNVVLKYGYQINGKGGQPNLNCSPFVLGHSGESKNPVSRNVSQVNKGY